MTNSVCRLIYFLILHQKISLAWTFFLFLDFFAASCWLWLLLVLQCQVTGDQVTALRQVLDDSERKVMSLCKSFLDSCKKQIKPDSSDIILFVTDELKKRTCCRFIRLDMQVSTFSVLVLSLFYTNVFCCSCWDISFTYLVSYGMLITWRVLMIIIILFSIILV